MSLSVLLRCFGGPNDGDMITAGESDCVVVPQMTPIQWTVEPMSLSSYHVETVRYDARRFWFHDDHPARCRCPYDPYRDVRVPDRSAPCLQEYRCLVRPGYSEQRVVDAMRALAAIAYALHSTTAAAESRWMQFIRDDAGEPPSYLGGETARRHVMTVEVDRTAITEAFRRLAETASRLDPPRSEGYVPASAWDACMDTLTSLDAQHWSPSETGPERCWRCDASQATTDVGLCDGCRTDLAHSEVES